MRFGTRLARSLIRLLVRLTSRVTIHGAERLPTSGAFIVAANHVGRMDVPLVFTLLVRDDIILFVAEKYRAQAIWRWLVKRFDAIFIDRYNADFTSLRKALKRLQAGGVLVLAPEGTRSPSGTLIEARTGGSYLAGKAGLMTIPVALTGTMDREVKARLKRGQRLDVTVRVGQPIPPPDLTTGDRAAALQAHTEEIMCQIAALLPPAQRGIYAAHPRLAEILASAT